MRDVQIGSRKSEFSTLMITIHYFTDNGIRITQALVGHLYFTFFQEGTDDRGRNIDVIYPEGIIFDDLNTQFFAVAHIILESLRTVMTKTMIITDKEFPYMEMVVEYLLHKLAR